MSFNEQLFQEIFDFAKNGVYLPLMKNFQAQPQEETEDMVVYRAVIATQEPNVNYIVPDEQTLKNIAAACNRETAKDDIPIFQNHNSYNFQIGVMLTAEYDEKRRQTTGTFNISKDAETEVLRHRIALGIVRDMSPKLIGPAVCNVCDESMYRYGGCVNDHWLGERIKVEGKEIIVTATYKDAHVIEVSVVSKGAFQSSTMFSENIELMNSAIKAGALSEKGLHILCHNYAMDMETFTVPKTRPKPNPKPKNNGGKKMPAPATLDILNPDYVIEEKDLELSNMQILHGKVVDLTADVASRDAQLEEKKDMVLGTEFAAVQTKYDEEHGKVIQLQGKLAESDATISEHEACITHVRDKAIEFYAKIRGVEVNNETDTLFTKRKQVLEASHSLPYLLSAFEQYMKDFYADATTFGGETTKPVRTAAEEIIVVNPNHFGNL